MAPKGAVVCWLHNSLWCVCLLIIDWLNKVGAGLQQFFGVLLVVLVLLPKREQSFLQFLVGCTLVPLEPPFGHQSDLQIH